MTRQRLLQTILQGAGLLLVVVSISACQAGKPVSAGEDDVISLDLSRIRAEMLPLKPGADSYPPSTAIADYFRFYGLGHGECRHLFGTFVVQGRTLAGHIFLPAQAKGTIFLLHGYYDHSGIMSRLIAFCLDEGLAVAIFDLPGHGLSSGPRFAINDFAEYAAALTAFVDLCQDHLPSPFHLMAHSLGCAIAYEYLQNSTQASFVKIIFLAPLIHSRPWLPSKFFYLLSKPFTSKVPRIHRHNSSDPDFLAFTKKDPLQQEKIVNLDFLGALFRWEKRAQQYSMRNQALLIIQGQDDVLLDWPYNITFLKARFSEVKSQLIAGANHQLANESPALRAELFGHLKAYFDD